MTKSGSQEAAAAEPAPASATAPATAIERFSRPIRVRAAGALCRICKVVASSGNLEKDVCQNLKTSLAKLLSQVKDNLVERELTAGLTSLVAPSPKSTTSAGKGHSPETIPPLPSAAAASSSSSLGEGSKANNENVVRG